MSDFITQDPLWLPTVKYKAGRYRPVRIADEPITAHYRFIKNVSRVAGRTCNNV